MQKNIARFFPYAISTAVLAILLLYMYVWVWATPYLGFHLRLPGGEISLIYAEDPTGSALQPGDRLLQAGEVTWDAYNQSLRQPLFGHLEAGDQILLHVARGNQVIQIPWTIQPPTWMELSDRFDMIWLPYVFWAVGTASLFLLKPRDTLWRLLFAFNYLTALWLAAGIVSNTAYWQSRIVMRMAIWLSWPVYWHLHWYFPKPLGRLPAWLVWGGYGLAGLIALAQWFELIPSALYALAFALAVIGSVILLVVHAARRPEQRRDLGLLALAVALVVIPLVGLGAAQQFGETAWFRAGSLLALPGLPVAYFYAVHRRQHGGLEPRANRVIALILFGSLLFLVGGLIAAGGLISGENAPAISAIIAPILLTGLVTAVGYSSFQTWVGRRLLGMPTSSSRLLERYSAHIITSLSEERLVRVIRDEVLPTLLIRQAALLCPNGDGSLKPVLTLGLADERRPEDKLLPEAADLPALLAAAGKYLPDPLGGAPNSPFPWVRLVLPLRVDGQVIGVCLLGQRDVDDAYAPSEIPTLQALMDQTALALVNIEQANLLRSLYRTNINGHEAERSRLAHELHDDVLNQMSLLALTIEEPSEQFQTAYAAAAAHIRQIISGLRPTMLNYGLYSALKELADEAYAQVGSDVRIVLDIPPSQARYDPEMELHLYRIVQQACQNALKHAQASEICISGRLESGLVELSVADNGQGFDASKPLDLTGLLEGRHFGMAWMYERAALAGARLEITSTVRKGTQVQITWQGEA